MELILIFVWVLVAATTLATWSLASPRANDIWNKQFKLLIRNQFKPFQLYLEGPEIVQNPVNVVGPSSAT